MTFVQMLFYLYHIFPSLSCLKYISMGVGNVYSILFSCQPATRSNKINCYTVNFLHCTPQSARIFLQSSELGPPTPPPHPQASVSPFGSGGGTHSLGGEGLEGPNSDEGTDTVLLYVCYVLCAVHTQLS
jgi:hypothetical protein